MKTKILPLPVKADESDAGVFIAYASTFTREPDAYGDVVAKGAFVDSLKQWEDSGNSIPILWGHDFSDPYKNIGYVTKAYEDEHGLKIFGQLDLDNPLAKQVYRLIKTRRVTQMSFAFDVLNAGLIEEDGKEKNELRELKLYEVSIVPVGANQDTEILEVKQAKADDEDLVVDDVSEIEWPAPIAEALEILNQAVFEVLENASTDDNDNQGPTGDEPETQDTGLKSRVDALETELAILDLELGEQK